ncbi:hypothetical protein FOZ63_017767, partial [Perkinsus olseni]
SIQHYPNTAEAEELLDKFMIECPELMRKEELGESLEHRKIFAYVLTKKDTPVGEAKPRLMVTSLMHSREPGSMLVWWNFYAANLTVANMYSGDVIQTRGRADAQCGVDGRVERRSESSTRAAQPPADLVQAGVRRNTSEIPRYSDHF